MVQTIILGIVQGLCEFLPVSSSGHLALMQYFFGFTNENLVAFDLLLHVPTVLVILIFFWRDVIRILSEWFGGWSSSQKRSGWFYGWAILIATIMTAAGLPLRKLVDELSSSPFYVGCGLIFTSIIMFVIPLISRENRNASIIKVAIVVGIAQGIAVLPGVSRSGMTIMAALLMGLSVSEAFKFSFLISVPAVLGASLLEALKMMKSGEAIFLPDGAIWALVAAFVFGFAALATMKRLVLAGKWGYFSLYCFVVGVCAIVFTL